MLNTLKKTILVLTVLSLLCSAICSMLLVAFAEPVNNSFREIAATEVFTDEPVRDEDLTTILESGLAAYNSGKQSLKFVVLSDIGVYMEIVGSSPGNDYENADDISDAASPLAIIVYADESYNGNAAFTAGRACQNMVIAADTLGYGTKLTTNLSSTLNGENHDTYCMEMGVDSAMKAQAVLLMGYTDYDATGSTRTDFHDSIDNSVIFIE